MRCWRASSLALLGVCHLLLCLTLRLPDPPRPGDPLRALRADSQVARLRVQDAIAEGRRGDLRFLSAELPPHLKLYGLLGAGAARVSSRLSASQATTLAVALGNTACLLSLLGALGGLAQALFGARAGDRAVLLALWPSLLLHCSQPLRDPLYLALLLALLRACVAVVQHRRPLRAGALALVLSLCLWRVRAEIAPLLLLLVILASLLTLLRAARRRPDLAVNAAALLLLAAPLLWSLLPDDVCRYEAAAGAPLLPGSARPAACPPHSPLASIDRVRWLRSKFLAKYPAARSNIDSEVLLPTPGAALRYLPRALLVAALSPFPWRWPALTPLPLRLLVGAEMLLLYGLQALVLRGLWRGAYRAPAAWLLLAFALASLAALGLSVANQGALYRLRYGYALVCVVLAVGALPGSSAVVGSRERSRGEHPGNH